MMKPVNFGIDLGTTNSSIAKYDGNRSAGVQEPRRTKETLASVVLSVLIEYWLVTNKRTPHQGRGECLWQFQTQNGYR